MPDGEPPYVESAPSSDLADVVRQVWRYEAASASGRIERIPPDGCAEIIIHFGEPYGEVGADGTMRGQPRLLFAGQLTRPLAIAAQGRVATLGVRFEPDGARAVFGEPMSTATDRRIDLVDHWGGLARAFLVEIGGAANWKTRFAIAEHFVRERSAGHAPDPIVRAAVRRLEVGAPGDQPAEISERQLQRRFLDRVGVSPRTLRAIFRFRRVFQAIESPNEPDWVAAALAAGYFDQPQMARDFRRFLGCTASDWARQKLGLAALIASQSYKPAGSESRNK